MDIYNNIPPKKEWKRVVAAMSLFEYLILLPNILATYYFSKNTAHGARNGNYLYVFGYLLMIAYNVSIKSEIQIFYFSLLWTMTFYGLIKTAFRRNRTK